MKCYECIEQLSAYRDHMLTLQKQKEVEIHLETCPSCKEEMKILTKILEELNTLPNSEVPEGVHQNIMQRIYEDKEATKKSNDLTTWVKYITSAAAVLLIVVVLLDGTAMINDKKSRVLRTESASEIQLQDNRMISDEPIMEEYKISQEAGQVENEIKPFMSGAKNGEIDNEKSEVWEVVSSEKVEVIERIQKHIETYEIRAQYIPNEVNPTTIMIYGVINKNELFDSMAELESDISINKKELGGENLEIIIKE